jgi:hypothetical protein
MLVTHGWGITSEVNWCSTSTCPSVCAEDEIACSIYGQKKHGKGEGGEAKHSSLSNQNKLSQMGHLSIWDMDLLQFA